MKKNIDGITFQAILVKATTTVDGGWRISFDVAHSDTDKIVDLSTLLQKLLQLAVVPVVN